MEMKSLLKVLFVVVVLFTGGCDYATGGKDFITIEKRLFQKAHDFKKNDYVIESLPPLMKQFETDVDLAWANYILGSAYFFRAEKDLSRVSKKSRMFVAIPDRAIKDLERALQYLEEAVWYDKNGDIAAKALFMSGQALDVGFLQRFQEAMVYYQRVMNMSLDSDSGRKSLERYRILSEWYGGKKTEFN
jgi:tetratricopeptide (TPR) repeat protein